VSESRAHALGVQRLRDLGFIAPARGTPSFGHVVRNIVRNHAAEHYRDDDGNKDVDEIALAVEEVGALVKGMIPDGYRIDASTHQVIACEVESWSPVRGRSLDRYIALWAYFDGHPIWTFGLVVVDARDLHAREFALGDIWYARIVDYCRQKDATA